MHCFIHVLSGMHASVFINIRHTSLLTSLPLLPSLCSVNWSCVRWVTHAASLSVGCCCRWWLWCCWWSPEWCSRVKRCCCTCGLPSSSSHIYTMESQWCVLLLTHTYFHTLTHAHAHCAFLHPTHEGMLLSRFSGCGWSAVLRNNESSMTERMYFLFLFA